MTETQTPPPETEHQRAEKFFLLQEIAKKVTEVIGDKEFCVSVCLTPMGVEAAPGVYTTLPTQEQHLQLLRVATKIVEQQHKNPFIRTIRSNPASETKQ